MADTTKENCTDTTDSERAENPQPHVNTFRRWAGVPLAAALYWGGAWFMVHSLYYETYADALGLPAELALVPPLTAELLVVEALVGFFALTGIMQLIRIMRLSGIMRLTPWILAVFLLFGLGAAKARFDAQTKSTWTVVNHPDLHQPGTWVLLASDDERIIVTRAVNGYLVRGSTFSLSRAPKTGPVAYERRKLGRLNTLPLE